ncbi:MAG: UDP-N-acetylglucosamine--N-acetylmuramyl-(pentapeptide) pyrophosphoryl-undecaprenol N-acetylglucosamine transferase [Candidatus Fermentibacterota bacterium]
MIRAFFAAGGTGGHISPALAVASAMEELGDVDARFIATCRTVDRRMYAPLGERVYYIDSPRIDRGGPRSLLLPFRALSTLRLVRGILRAGAADVLLGTGGYSSFYAMVAARTLGIPAVLHESNTVAGRSNRLASRFADLTLTGFGAGRAGLSGTVERAGNPVRPSLSRMNPLEARRTLGIPMDRPAVLFLGGSQGARALNDLALRAPEEVFVILQCGETDLLRVRKEAGERRGIRVVAFADDPSALYSAADLAVARAGAMTTAELCWFRLPSVLVPYPYAAGDHQRGNAGELESAGGAVMLDQDVAGKSLWPLVESLLEEPERRRGMSTALAGLMPENPAYAIARRLLETAGEGGGL